MRRRGRPCRRRAVVERTCTDGGKSQLPGGVDGRAARCAAAGESRARGMPSRSKAERGCLYKLEVTNFKSYGGTLTIGPFKDFTCVIGPNGSGAVHARARPGTASRPVKAVPPAVAGVPRRIVVLSRARCGKPSSHCACSDHWVGSCPCLQPRAGAEQPFTLACPAAGKSNLMDAVSFVMGVNTKDLRGAKVADFRSHGLSKSDANTSVTLHHRDTSRRSLPLVAAICSVL